MVLWPTKHWCCAFSKCARKTCQLYVADCHVHQKGKPMPMVETHGRMHPQCIASLCKEKKEESKSTRTLVFCALNYCIALFIHPRSAPMPQYVTPKLRWSIWSGSTCVRSGVRSTRLVRCPIGGLQLFRKPNFNVECLLQRGALIFKPTGRKIWEALESESPVMGHPTTMPILSHFAGSPGKLCTSFNVPLHLLKSLCWHGHCFCGQVLIVL